MYELHFRMTELKEGGMEKGRKGGKEERKKKKEKRLRTLVNQRPKSLLLGVG